MSLERIHALLVEDESDSLQMLSLILKHYGITVAVARNGQECLDALPDVQPDIVVMDLSMPELDGWHALMQMRENEQTASIPVIAITAYHSVNVAQDARRQGFDAYLAKPFDPLVLIAEIERLIR